MVTLLKPSLHSIFALFYTTVSADYDSPDLIDDVRKIIAKKTNYNRNEYPGHELDIPTTIYIQMYIEGMSSFRAQTMDFQVDIYFQEKWIDKRLAHSGAKRILLKDHHLLQLIWHPDIYFANARTAQFHDVTQPNFLVWIYPNGTVWYDCRISLTVLCMQNLARYPLDSQTCALRILSYAHDTDEIIIRWNEPNPIEVNSEIRMPDMRLRSIQHILRNDSYATGVWSCALAEFHVDREIMHHIIQVSLSITTLLTLTTQSSAARMALPQASYVKAIDVWMGACMAFVFSAMIEFTVVNYCTRRKVKKEVSSASGLTEQVHNLVTQYKERQPYQNCTIYEVALYDDNTNVQNLEKKQIREMNRSSLLLKRNLLSDKKRKGVEERLNRVEENRKYAQMIDRRSRFYFPLSFIIFNLFYWVYYINYAADTIE